MLGRITTTRPPATRGRTRAGRSAAAGTGGGLRGPGAPIPRRPWPSRCSSRCPPAASRASSGCAGEPPLSAGSVAAAVLGELGRVQVLLRGALEDPAIPIVPGAVARAGPGAVGVVPVDGASHVLAPGGQSRERAVLGLVHRDPPSAHVDEPAVTRRQFVDGSPHGLGDQHVDGALVGHPRGDRAEEVPAGPRPPPLPPPPQGDVAPAPPPPPPP